MTNMSGNVLTLCLSVKISRIEDEIYTAVQIVLPCKPTCLSTLN